MHSGWYTGHHSLTRILLRRQNLRSIHANAFNVPTLAKLVELNLSVQFGWLKMYNGAFRGLESLQQFRLDCVTVDDFSIGLFNPFRISLCDARFTVWPNNINLDGIFGNEPFRGIEKLVIKNVQTPQTIFRLLAATNFTYMRRLHKLWLSNCGIEVIAADAFNGIARTLDYIRLDNNRIKTINIDMLRRPSEMKKNKNIFFYRIVRYFRLVHMQSARSDRADTYAARF